MSVRLDSEEQSDNDVEFEIDSTKFKEIVKQYKR